jgi:hypothetical protein
MMWFGATYLHFLTRETTIDLHSLGGGLLVAGKGRSVSLA